MTGFLAPLLELIHLPLHSCAFLRGRISPARAYKLAFFFTFCWLVQFTAIFIFDNVGKMRGTQPGTFALDVVRNLLAAAVAMLYFAYAVVGCIASRKYKVRRRTESVAVPSDISKLDKSEKMALLRDELRAEVREELRVELRDEVRREVRREVEREVRAASDAGRAGSVSPPSSSSPPPLSANAARLSRPGPTSVMSPRWTRAELSAEREAAELEAAKRRSQGPRLRYP